MPRRSLLLCATFLLGAVAAADAHVALSPAFAPGGMVVRAVLTVGHGCEGQATTTLRVLIDDRLPWVEAEAKDGWTLEVASRSVAPEPGRPFFSREIRWAGGNLDAEATGEFAIAVELPQAEAGTILYFPVVQECGNAVHRWIETPLPGERPDMLAEPAPFLVIGGTPAAPHAH